MTGTLKVDPIIDSQNRLFYLVTITCQHGTGVRSTERTAILARSVAIRWFKATHVECDCTF
jgi:hypothetical protein